MTLQRIASDRRGFTLIELVIVTAIIGILASAVLPLARWSVKRSKEHELQQNLRILRNAIDRYRDAAEAGIIEVPEGGTGFPESLAVLLEGVPMIAEMPVPVPAVGGEYDATGPGLTGGLATLAQQQAAAAAGGAGGFPGGGTGGNATGSTRAGGMQGAGGSSSGSAFGGAFGQGGGRTQFSAGQSSSGLQLGGGASRGAAGSTFGQQGSGSGGLSMGGAFSRQGGAGGLGSGSGAGSGSVFGGGLGGLGARGGGAGDGPAEPILGPDGKPLMLVLLRRLPVDPFTGKADWGLRCYGEPPEDRLWCGKDVFDIYSKSPAKAINGTNYKDW